MIVESLLGQIAVSRRCQSRAENVTTASSDLGTRSRPQNLEFGLALVARMRTIRQSGSDLQRVDGQNAAAQLCEQVQPTCPCNDRPGFAGRLAFEKAFQK